MLVGLFVSGFAAIVSLVLLLIVPQELDRSLKLDTSQNLKLTRFEIYYIKSQNFEKWGNHSHGSKMTLSKKYTFFNITSGLLTGQEINFELTPEYEYHYTEVLLNATYQPNVIITVIFITGN
jgi:hypothetical protein